MAFWNRRSSRPRRVDRLHAEGETPWYDRLRSPRTLWQLVILVCTLAAMLLMTQVPRTPLPVRKGEKARHPILARVDFEYIDRGVTVDVRELTSLLRVPGLYAPDARQSVAMKESLLALVGETGKAETVEKVTESLRSAWKMTPEMFEAIKKAIGDQGAGLPAIQEAVAKATASLGEPLSLPIVTDEDYQRASARVARVRELRSKLPAGLTPDTVPILEEPAAQIIVLLPEGEQAVPLQNVLTAAQTDRIQGRIDKLIRPHLEPVFGDKVTTALAAAMASRIGPTLVYDQAKTENRREDVRASVEPVPIPHKANTTLVEAGKEITDADLRILGQERDARMARLGWLRRSLAWVGAAAVFAVLIGIVALFAVRFQKNVARSVPRTLMLAVLACLVVGVGKTVAQAEGPSEGPEAVYALLVTTTGLVLTIAYSETFALAMTWSLVLALAIAVRADLDWALTAVAGTSAAVLSLGKVNSRSKLLKVGALAGAVFFVTRAALALWRINYDETSLWAIPAATLWPASLNLCGGVAAGVVMLAILPFIERVFGIVTNISLLELCDINQPALRRLALEAPGTYTHSLLIGTLAEAAAEAIGANGLLARVGAYFHDIGKANKPRYFGENVQGGQSAHEGLSPAMSKLIIQSHVKDGLEMADRLGLPPVIKQFIEEHHGTTLAEYFYREARRQAEENGTPPPSEEEYRYPGPKPRSKETAIVMLSDVAEGTARSLKDRSPARVSATVHDMIARRVLDGQLDRCGLTMADLNKIEETLTKTLLSVYHGRVPYPAEQSSAGEPAAADRHAASAATDQQGPAAQK